MEQDDMDDMGGEEIVCVSDLSLEVSWEKSGIFGCGYL
jgi:hypothetical protein